MRILHVIPTLALSYGGPSIVCRDMCRALAERGEDITVYTTNRDYPDGELDVPVNEPVMQDGYTIWYFPVQFPLYMVSLDMHKALRYYAKDFDLIHIHGIYRFPQASAAYYGRKYDIPYIITPHGSLDPFLFYKRKRRLMKRAYENLVEFRNLNNAAAIHFTTEEEMLLTSPLGLEAEGVVIPNGLDLDAYQSLPEYGKFREKYELGDKKIILHLGRINFKKGLDILVKAFAQLCSNNENICLVLAGPDNEGYGRQVKRWLTEKNVMDKAVFTGMLSGVDKLSALKDADIFALPSYSENFGMAVVEAMACGLPVVISDKVNIWREVQRAGAGLVTACNSDEFAKAILTLFDDDSRRRMGEAGKVFVSENYDWKIVVNDLLRVYQDILTKPNSGL